MSSSEAPQKSVRLYGMDNLRTFTCLSVLLSHLVLPYLQSFAGVFWFTPSLPNEQIPFAIVLPLFFFVNIVAMSLFFMISGYFFPTSYDKQGFSVFLKKKAQRLLLPSIFCYIFFNLLFPVPLMHIWFLEILFLFSVVYALIRMYTGFKIKEGSSFSTIVLIAFSLLIGVVSIFIRYKYPSGYIIQKYFIYIEPGKMLSYIAAFTLGIIARRKGWFYPVEKKNIGILTLFSLLFVALCTVTGSVNDTDYMYSRKYVLMECSLGILISFILIWVVNRWGNKTNRLISFVSENCMGIYLFHLPILYFLQKLTETWQIYFPLKFLGLSVTVLLLATLVSTLVRKIPYVNRCI